MRIDIHCKLCIGRVFIKNLIISCNIIKLLKSAKRKKNQIHSYMSGFVFGMFNDFMHLNSNHNDDDANGSSRKSTEVVWEKGHENQTCGGETLAIQRRQCHSCDTFYSSSSSLLMNSLRKSTLCFSYLVIFSLFFFILLNSLVYALCCAAMQLFLLYAL